MMMPFLFELSEVNLFHDTRNISLAFISDSVISNTLPCGS
jgi:hypothetical protein